MKGINAPADENRDSNGEARPSEKTSFSVSMDEDLVGKMDARAASLSMNRSKYIGQLARTDLGIGGDVVIRPTRQNRK